jgi:mannose-6-phosphate isomerase-like protein (cupin superfamily)
MLCVQFVSASNYGAQSDSCYAARPRSITGEHAESHDKSEQLLLLLEGRLRADIGGKILAMNMGDVVIIPPRVKHKFTNPGDTRAVTFNVYCPSEYPLDEKGW